MFYASPSYYAERKIQRFGIAELLPSGGGSLFPHSIFDPCILDGGAESASCISIADTAIVFVQESCRTVRPGRLAYDSRRTYFSYSQRSGIPFED